MPGVNSLDDSPYRPPVTTGMTARVARRVRFGQRAEHVQEQRLAQRARLLGPVQHRDPAPRVAGSAASRAAAGNGRYSRTCTTPTRSPRPPR